MLDLHAHTTYSDGVLTPSELVKTAAIAGVQALAISDHDTIAGWDEAIAAGQQHGVEIVPAVELSTIHRGRSLHILGFYPDRHQLDVPLRERREGRKQRAKAMIDRLADLGYPITLPKLGEGVAPSRPHLAAALVASGYVRDHNEAFERFLGDGQPACVEYPQFSAVEGLDLLRSCGAVPVWAHPYLFRGGLVEDVFPELLAAGLMGLEVYHPHQGRKQTQNLARLCAEFGLLATGGTDFHGIGNAPYPVTYTIEVDRLDQLKQVAGLSI